MEALHVKIEEILKPGEKSKVQNGVLHLPEAGKFTVVIKEYDDRRAALAKQITEKYKARNNAIDQRNKEGDELTERRNNWSKLDPKQQKEFLVDAEVYNSNAKLHNSNLAELDKQRATLEAQQNNLKEDYADVAWIYNVSSQPTFSQADVNSDIRKGTVEMTVHFPKALEGGGTAYIEAFHTGIFPDGTKPAQKMIINPDDCHPQNKVPYGCFISAKGTPKVIAAEWKDKKGFNIHEKVAFGSTVYLHVYTQGLFGQKLSIQLRDTKFINADLTLNESDADGQPIEKLTVQGPDKFFIRKIEAIAYDHKAQPQLDPPGDAISSNLLDLDKRPNATAPQYYKNIQKCVFAVFVEYNWQFEGGDEQEIHPIVYHNAIEGKKKELKDSVLKVSLSDATYTDQALHGNSPVLVEDSPQNKYGKKRIDFTFGVFIDGTLNNMYNSLAREEWENDQIKKKGKDIEDPTEHLKVAAHKQKDVGKEADHNYKYEDDSSYENALSNPAIIFQNYDIDKSTDEHRIFKVYSEGMGTETLADNNGNLKPKDYKEDGTIGYALGVGSSGIIERVKRAIELMVAKIKVDKKETIGSLTVDVFGFSRGAASARNFVHEITLGAEAANYKVTSDGDSTISYYVNHNGYDVSDEYADKDLPEHGWLGYLLIHKGLTFDNLIIRFAGIYDTVPHQGLLQGNDINDLGLNSISKAKFTVHLVAGDEHRKNFSLVDIRCITGVVGGGRSKKGVELYLPGVHCDVGGSYVEGRKEVNGRLQVNQLLDQNNLHKERDRLIQQGWYQPHEIKVEWDNPLRMWAYAAAQTLVGKRQHVSNQYSFIPLQIMVKYALDKGLFIKTDGITRNYEFRDSPFTSLAFLKKIRSRLWDYAFNGGRKYDYETLEQTTMVSDANDKNAIPREEERRKQEEESINVDIKRLRNQYLHWNANYGEGGSAMDSVKKVLAQPNEPNFEHDKRQREVRG